MQNIDKEKFGRFVSTLRKEQGITQKELARRLYISDKAVSKWETGQSIPTVDLLIPLSEILGVTVTELLECRRMETPRSIPAEDVENIVKKAVNFNEEDTGKRKINKKFLPVYCISLVVAVGQLCVLPFIMAKNSGMYEAIQLTLGMASVFGGYFCLFAKDRLPAYYDDNKIGYYADGPFRMNLVGMNINNSNWRHILRYIRIWCFVMMNLTTVIYVFFYLMFIWLSNFAGRWIISYTVPFVTLVVIVFSLIIPVYHIGNKYE